MSSHSVEVVSRSAILGEGPHWDEVENVLYYVDIKGKEVRRYDPSSKEETAVKIDKGTVSLVVPVHGQKNKFIVSVGRNISVMTWDGQSEKLSNFEVIAEVDDEEGKRENRLNDGKADPSGRLWAGTMGHESGPNDFTLNNGALFSLSKNRSVSKHVSGITCSNGLAWTQDNKTMYYIDSLTYKVEVYDFDIEKGLPTNRRTAFDFKANGVEGLPDGMTIDSNGKLWIACFDGHQVIQVDPETGKLLQSIPLPSPKITSVVFGGPNLDELYVTSASMDLSSEELAKYPTAGCTYHIKGVNAKGLPMDRVKLTMSQISVEAVTRSTILGEGPHWDSNENVLYYVDILAKEVRKYNPATNQENIVKIDGAAVSFVIPVEGRTNEFLIGVGHHVCLMTWDGESDKPSKIEKLAAVDEEDDKAKNQLNDGKADASGRLWAGTVGEFEKIRECPKGSLFSFPQNKVAYKHVENISCSNGLAWSRDNQYFYYIDTFAEKVEAFDFDIKNGVISNRRTVFDFKENGINGMPDGMTIDTDNKLWVACFQGSQVIQIDPENGKLLQSIPIPCPQVTSVAFGGPNLNELYVTSGSMRLTPEETTNHPTAGCTYRITGIYAKGFPMYSIKL